jgi:AP-2 complex subunit alpha
MPVYEDSPSSLLSKINDMAAVRPAVAASAASARDRRRTPNHPGSATAGGIAGPPARNGSVVAVSGASASAPAPAAAAVASAPIVDIFGDEPAATPAPTEVAITADAATVTPGTEKWSTRFITNNDGVLYEDGLLQVGVKSSFKGALGQVALYFGNRSPSTLDGFNVSIHMGSAMSKLKLSTSPAPDRSVPAGKQVNTIVKIECIADFADSPIVAVGFSIAGRAFSINLALPILLHKFCHPVEAMDQAVFSTRWKALSLAGLESQQIVQAKADINLEVVKKHIEGLGLGVIAGIDRNPTNFVGVGILHTTAGQVGVLLRLEPNLEGKMFRLTIRASKEGIATVLTERLATVL